MEEVEENGTAGRIVWNDRLAAPGLQPGAQRITVVGGIGQTARRTQGGHKGGSDGRVPAMAQADNQPPGAAGLIDRCMDFRGPPAADRCALTWVASSMSTTGGRLAAANSANTRSQTPFRAQRTNRLYRSTGFSTTQPSAR